MLISKKKARKLYYRGFTVTFKFGNWSTTLRRFDPCDYDFNRIFEGIQQESVIVKCYASKTIN